MEWSNRQVPLLSNDKRAIRYCQQQKIEVIDLPQLLRALWVTGIISKSSVKQIIKRLANIENLVLNQVDKAKIFAPRQHKI